MTTYQQWHLILGVITIAVILTLVPIAASQARQARFGAARRYWLIALVAFLMLALVQVVVLIWLQGERWPDAFAAMQIKGLFIVLLLAGACRIGYEAMQQIERLRKRLQEGEQNLRHYQRNLESLVERRTNALRAEVMRRREAQEALSRNVAAMEADLRLARDLQMALLTPPLDTPFCHCRVWQQPHGEVCGDTYAFSVDGDYLRIFLGDAMGHGVAAALLTNLIQGGLHTVPVDAGGPETLQWLNGLLTQQDTDTFTTGVHLVITPDGEFKLTSAGSPEMLIVRAAGGGTEVIPGAGLPLGLMEDLPEDYAARSGRFGAGDKFFLYSDGLYEWRNADEELFGEARLRQALTRHAFAHDDLQAIGDATLAEVRKFSGGTEPGDDLTLIIGQFRAA